MKHRIQIILIVALSIAIIGIFNYCSNTETSNKSFGTTTNTNTPYNYGHLANNNLAELQPLARVNEVQQPTQDIDNIYPFNVVTIDEPLSEATINAVPQKVSVLQGRDISLVIGGEALKQEVDISVTPLTSTSIPDVPEYMQNLTRENKGYRLLPDGQKFEKDITIALTYDSTQIPFGYTSEDIYTYFYNDTLKMWQRIERDSINIEKQIVY